MATAIAAARTGAVLCYDTVYKGTFCKDTESNYAGLSLGANAVTEFFTFCIQDKYYSFIIHCF